MREIRSGMRHGKNTQIVLDFYSAACYYMRDDLKEMTEMNAAACEKYITSQGFGGILFPSEGACSFISPVLFFQR